ncbi:MAG: tetratricopeptide repeat protein [Maricaulaceae bacterium]
MRASIVVGMALAVIAGAPGRASAQCDDLAPAAQAVSALIEAGDTKRAVKDAGAIVEQNPDCIDAHLALIDAIGVRFDDVGPLRALPLARRYQAVLADALALAPDNVEARTAEIRFLVIAPGVAGGDTEQARIRTAELTRIDPLAGARMSVQLARKDDDTAALIAALARVVELAPDDDTARNEWVRRLILAEDYDAASEALEGWPLSADTSPWAKLQHAYLSGVLRVRADFEPDAAVTHLRRYLDQLPAYGGERSLPSRANGLAFLGAALEAQGQLQAALEAYDAVLKDEPDNTRAQEGAERLRAARDTP